MTFQNTAREWTAVHDQSPVMRLTSRIFSTGESSAYRTPALISFSAHSSICAVFIVVNRICAARKMTAMLQQS